jgi:signal transduction histidine kinase
VQDLTAAGFGHLIAERMAAQHVSISARWLERLQELLTVEANEVFPTEHLLDHIPALIREVASYIRAPESEAVAANTAIPSKAQELGELRHAQKASVHQLLAEYRLLGGILVHFVQEELERLEVPPAASEVLAVLRRLHEALWVLMQTTVNTFVSQYTETIASHAARLESFNRMVSHELRQPLGALMYALPLVSAETSRGDALRQEHHIAVMERNILRLTKLVEQLEVLSRLRTRPADTPDVQQTDIATVAAEVARQLREMADARGVNIEVVEPLPTLTIDTARLELILMNLLSNAVKYCDPEKPHRFVRVEAAPADDPSMVCVAVRDNGLGIPEDSLRTVFRRFVRAHADRDPELGVRGSGLGLAIAVECAEAVGGDIRVESTVGTGTSFFVLVPREQARPAAEGQPI